MPINEYEAVCNSEKNRFQFACPIFNSTVGAADCFTLHDDHMRGRKHPDRGGCHACMSASKCPAPYMLKEAWSNKDRYFSGEPKVGSVSADVLGQIGPIMVLVSALDRYGATSEEREAIAASVHEGSGRSSEERRSVSRGTVRRQAPISGLGNALNEMERAEKAAALTGAGDFAEAITKAVAAESAATPALSVTVISADRPVETGTLRGDTIMTNGSAVAFEGEPPAKPLKGGRKTLLDIAREKTGASK